MKLSKLLTTIIDWFYIPPVKAVLPLQTFRYAACGGLNMGLNLLLYYVTYHYILGRQNLDLGFWDFPGDWFDRHIVISPHIAAGVIVFPIITFTGFWLNKHVAFKHSPLGRGTQFFRYLLSVAGSLALYYVCMKFFVEMCHIWATPSQALTTIVTVVYSYLMQKHFSFRGSADI